MTPTFKAGRDGSVTARFPADYAQLISVMFTELITLLGTHAEPAATRSTDPLAIELGLADLGLPELDPDGPAPAAPEDPALARLFPDAYREDPAAAAEFRRYTEPDLAAQKRARAETVLQSLRRIPKGGKLTLEPAEAASWLTAMNDLRLVMGTQLGIVEDEQDLAQSPDPADPRNYLLSVYFYLTYLQESLIEAISKS
ncbi:MAG TPA: DUF2017 domain-containing protein [Actinocrinis sp.]|nr:DUF2017 domain-containing protein [Actinocrinis sp.]